MERIQRINRSKLVKIKCANGDDKLQSAGDNLKLGQKK